MLHTQQEDQKAVARVVTEGMLETVRSRMLQHGFRPFTESDRIRLGTSALRIEVQRYCLCATINDRLGVAAGTRFLPLNRQHLTEEGIADIVRNGFDAKQPCNNDIRWFVRINGQN